MDNVDENIDDYNPSIKRKILIVFDDMIADIMINKKFQIIVKELFIGCRKLNISLAFITQSYFSIPKDVKLNSTQYLVMKIDRKELQILQLIILQILIITILRGFTENAQENRILFLPIGTILLASDPVRSRKYLLPSYKNDSN